MRRPPPPQPPSPKPAAEFFSTPPEFRAPSPEQEQLRGSTSFPGAPFPRKHVLRVSGPKLELRRQGRRGVVFFGGGGSPFSFSGRQTYLGSLAPQLGRQAIGTPVRHISPRSSVGFFWGAFEQQV